MENQSSDQIIALVLAAGMSRRFGSDKRLTVIPQTALTLIEATLKGVSHVFSSTHVVIRPDDGDSLVSKLNGYSWNRNLHAHEGMGTSIATGVHHISTLYPKAQAVAIVLADMPWILPQTYHQLLRLADSQNIVRPTYNGKAGHPVIIGRAYWQELVRLEGDTGARALLKKGGVNLISVPVADPNVLRDVDRVEDL